MRLKVTYMCVSYPSKKSWSNGLSLAVYSCQTDSAPPHPMHGKQMPALVGLSVIFSLSYDMYVLFLVM